MTGASTEPQTAANATAGEAKPATARLAGPSKLYRVAPWRGAVFMARRLPHFILGRLAVHGAQAYWLSCARRRRVVFENLLPVVNGDRLAARIATRELFAQFGLKLADLWRYESGLSIYNLFNSLTGWEHYEAAHAQGRGVLFLTIHLGNWEFGAPLLTQRGIRLHVITLEEPEARFTEFRQRARARWGIETLALGNDPFGAVEIVRRLEANNSVALLMDRPPDSTSVRIELFGRPFNASISAAELARATGCALLPVYLPRTSRGYAAQILPPVTYDRREIGSREGRIQLTQKIMQCFEPAIRLYATQWFHFVPIWPR